MKVLGSPASTSRAKLQELVENIDAPCSVSWGWAVQGALNGQPRRNAVEQMQALSAANVPYVEITTSRPEAIRWLTQGHLVFGRMLLHTQGRDIVGPKHPRWGRSEYWSKVVPNISQEWRIHVFNGRSIARGLKIPTGPTRRKMPVRNRSNGWTMEHTSTPPDIVREVAKLAVPAVGYDFGAVDVLYTTDNQTLVLEVNKAPGLDDYTASQYARALERWAKREGARRLQ